MPGQPHTAQVPLESEWFSYVAGIRARDDKPDRDWKEWFASELRECAYEMLDSDEQLREYGMTAAPTGRYRLVDVPSPAVITARHFSGAPWVRPSSCPYVGRVVGLITWDWWSWGFDQREFFASNVLHAGRGYIASTNGPEVFEYIVEEDFPLWNAKQKGGFHDGDFFFEDDRYAAYVRGEIVKAVEALGLTPELFNGGTGHNPHRIDQFTPRRGQTWASCWETFDLHRDDVLRLWGLNVAGMQTSAFRNLIAPP